MAGKTFIRDGLGRFRRGGRAMTGKKVKTTRGLGKSRGTKRDAGTLSSGGNLAGVDPSKTGKTISGPTEEEVRGTKLKR